MLVREAKWFGRKITELGDANVFPMLNVGSHTEHFRVREQPWIDRHIFAPARRRGAKVVHLDLREAPGVDLVGDLTEPSFLARLAAMRFRSVFCSNLLEHVPNREEIGRATVEAVAPGGFLFVSCPNVFPYHPDPIDTMYRPGVEELAELFPGTDLVHGDRLACGTLVHYMIAKFSAAPFALFGNVFRRRAQLVHATHDGQSAVQWAPWLVRRFYQTCILLRKHLS